MTVPLVFESNIIGIQLSAIQWTMVERGTLILLLAQLVLMQKQISQPIHYHIRMGLILSGMVLIAVNISLSTSHALWLTFLIFLIIVLEEGVGRWLFYQSRT
jgi:hypothetical protein